MCWRGALPRPCDSGHDHGVVDALSPRRVGCPCSRYLNESAKSKMMEKLVADHTAACDEVEALGMSSEHVRSYKPHKISEKEHAQLDRLCVDTRNDDLMVERVLETAGMSSGKMFIAIGGRCLNSAVALRAQLAKMCAAAEERGRKKESARDKRQKIRDGAATILRAKPLPFRVMASAASSSATTKATDAGRAASSARVLLERVRATRRLQEEAFHLAEQQAAVAAAEADDGVAAAPSATRVEYVAPTAAEQAALGEAQEVEREPSAAEKKALAKRVLEEQERALPHGLFNGRKNKTGEDELAALLKFYLMDSPEELKGVGTWPIKKKLASLRKVFGCKFFFVN